jgi:FkbM family methyltransferase
LDNAVRPILESLGYVLWKREFFRYGVSPYVDIARLNRAWGRSVGVFFDVGANRGQTTQQALKEFPAARIFAFEPHPGTCQALRNSVSDDRLSIYQLALGDKCGHVALYEYGSSGDGSLINSLVSNARFPMQFGFSATEARVECTTIDAFCASTKIEIVDVLKIDTEGYDLNVIKGAQGMLREGRVRYIYTEFNDLFPKSGTEGGALLPIAEYLATFGFRYVATYTDFVLPEGDMFVCANALFACPPESSRRTINPSSL